MTCGAASPGGGHTCERDEHGPRGHVWHGTTVDDGHTASEGTTS